MALAIACSDTETQPTNDKAEVGVDAEAVASTIPDIVQKNIKDSYAGTCTWSTMGSSAQLWGSCGSTFYRVDYFSTSPKGTWRFNGYKRTYPDSTYHFQQSLNCNSVTTGVGCTRIPGHCADGSACADDGFGTAGAPAEASVYSNTQALTTTYACSNPPWGTMNRAIATANHQFGCDAFKWDNASFNDTFNNSCYWNGKTRSIRVANPVNIGTNSTWCAYTIYRSKSGPNTDKCRWYTAQCSSAGSADCFLSTITSSGNPDNCVGYN